MSDLQNTGDKNTGNWNTGDKNTGNENTGNENTGNENPGNRNSGHRNSGSLNSGSLNSGSLNSGNENPGNRNTGNRNSGSGNDGNRNAGNRNTGSWNTGSWNSGSGNAGFFNCDSPTTVRVFGKDCLREDWDAAIKPAFLYFEHCTRVKTQDMSEQEKTEYPYHKMAGGYLKVLDYKEAFQAAWVKASNKDRTLVENLPNFDADIFFEISGIDLRNNSTIISPKKIVVDGVIYVKEETSE